MLVIIHQKNSNNLFQTIAKTRADEKLFETIGEAQVTVQVKAVLLKIIIIALLFPIIVLKVDLMACFYKQTTSYTKTN